MPGTVQAAIVCSCREAVTERDDLPPDKPARPPRRRGRRRRKPGSTPSAPAGGLIPPVIKVEIQNIERLAGSRDDSQVAEREAKVAAATRELEEREARLAASAVELRERERRVSELEETFGPAADALESRESIERRERRVRELETSLRDRGQDLEQMELLAGAVEQDVGGVHAPPQPLEQLPGVHEPVEGACVLGPEGRDLLPRLRPVAAVDVVGRRDERDALGDVARSGRDRADLVAAPREGSLEETLRRKRGHGPHGITARGGRRSARGRRGAAILRATAKCPCAA